MNATDSRNARAREGTVRTTTHRIAPWNLGHDDDWLNIATVRGIASLHEVFQLNTPPGQDFTCVYVHAPDGGSTRGIAQWARTPTEQLAWVGDDYLAVTQAAVRHCVEVALTEVEEEMTDYEDCEKHGRQVVTYRETTDGYVGVIHWARLACGCQLMDEQVGDIT